MMSDRTKPYNIQLQMNSCVLLVQVTPLVLQGATVTTFMKRECRVVEDVRPIAYAVAAHSHIQVGDL
jgi:hypothetical protein